MALKVTVDGNRVYLGKQPVAAVLHRPRGKYQSRWLYPHATDKQRAHIIAMFLARQINNVLNDPRVDKDLIRALMDHCAPE